MLSTVADVEVSREQIYHLMRQLGQIDGEQERALLAAMIGLAVARINGQPSYVERIVEQEPPVIVRRAGQLPTIQAQFDQAFSPGVVGAAESVPGVRVGHLVIHA
jgi:uncharacterized radical SAM superfamily protein